MAGVKGKSGGPRANAGGYRPGSGPKRKAAAQSDSRDPLEFLLDVMQGLIDPSPSQLKAAATAAQYVHVKRAEGGKKDALTDAAKKAATGRFKPVAAPPKLVVNNK